MIKAKNQKVTIKTTSMGEMMTDYVLITKGILQTLVEHEGMTKEEACKEIDKAIRLGKAETAGEYMKVLMDDLTEILGFKGEEEHE